MSATLDISSAQMMAQQRPVAVPAPTADLAAAKKAATQFESVFISQFLGSMFQGIPTDGPFGGGEGEEMFRSVLLDQYSKQIELRGGFGLSAAITRQLLHAQEKLRGKANVQ